MIIYVGSRPKVGAGIVAVRDSDHRELPGTLLPPRNDIRDHSPDGFNWGYGGSGPSQLALALCIHALDGDVQRALHIYVKFRDATVRTLTDNWTMPQSHVKRVIEQIEGKTP